MATRVERGDATCRARSCRARCAITAITSLSLGDLCRWLGEQAEALGCNILPGFAAVDVLYENDRVAGVVTGEFGVARDGAHKPTIRPATSCAASTWCSPKAAAAVSVESSRRGSRLRGAADPQHFGIGLKEIWQIDPAKHRPGEVMHTVGWPLDDATDGGGFLYHAAGNRVYLGFIVSLGYSNPHLDPHAELQRWKEHPRIRAVLAGGERVHTVRAP